MIRIAFRYNDPRIFARLVCLLQGGDSAHCEVSGEWLGDQHKCVSASFLDKGVRRKWIDMPASKWRIYEFAGATPDDVEAYLSANDGEGYDWLGLMGFVIRRIKGFARRKFCSEVGADIMGLPDPWRYDLALLESVCARFGRRIQ